MLSFYFPTFGPSLPMGPLIPAEQDDWILEAVRADGRKFPATDLYQLLKALEAISDEDDVTPGSP